MLTLSGLLFAGLIFVLRVLNFAITTVRMVVTARQQRLLSSSLAFLEALIFAVVIAKIVNDLDNFVNLIAYCLGASVGTYIGIGLERRFVVSYRSVNIITSNNGHEIAISLRENGFGVTEHYGEGRDGTVTILRSIVNNRDVATVLRVTREIDPQAFITLEEARSIEHGWLRNEAPFRKLGG